MSWSALCVKALLSGMPLAGGLMVFVALATPLAALEDTDREKAGRKACEAKICRLILDKPEPKGDLTCDLGRAWGKAKIKEGAQSKNIQWSFGDARCKLNVAIPQKAIINALTKPKFTFTADPHTVNCDVQTGGGIKPVRAVVAPKLKFEGGRVRKIWIGLKEIDGPALLTGLVWTTAKLEDSLGIFHKDMVKEVNKFLHKTCPDEYGPDSRKSDGKKKDPDPKAATGKDKGKGSGAAKSGDGTKAGDFGNTDKTSDKTGKQKKPEQKPTETERKT